MQLNVLLTVAIALFQKNYCDYDPVFNIGDIVQNVDPERVHNKTIVEIDDSKVALEYNAKGGSVKQWVDKQFINEKFIVTSANLGKRLSKNRILDYKNFFIKIFGELNPLPSKFKYKAVLIGEKSAVKEIFHENIDIYKTIPMIWVTKNGKEEPSTLPMDPMIYYAGNYSEFKKYMGKNEDVSFETVILIGKNKYDENQFNTLSKDLFCGTIPSAIIIGDTPIKNNENEEIRFLEWHWTFPEHSILEKTPVTEIKYIKIDNKDFDSAVNDHVQFLENIELNYFMDLKDIKTLHTQLYKIVLPKEGSRIINEIESLKNFIIKIATEKVSDELANRDINPKEITKTITNNIEHIFSNFKNLKLYELQQIEDYDYIVVPDSIISSWAIESEKPQKIISFLQRRNIRNCSWEEKSNSDEKKTFVFLSINGYRKCSHTEMFSRIKNTIHNYIFLSYDDESKIIDNLVIREDNNVVDELMAQDRQKLTNIKYVVEKKEENVEIYEKISDLFENNNINPIYDYEHFSTNYKLTFKDKYEDIFEGGKAVLLRHNNSWIKQKISQLMPGDTVRIYQNTDKNKLFDVFLSEDRSGIYSEIDKSSKIWKNALVNYLKSNNINELTLLMWGKGCDISDLTIRKWCDLSDKDKFPMRDESIKIILEITKDQELEKNFKTVLKCKKKYRGIMISIGRDLSDEISDYIISDRSPESKGKILSKFSDQEIDVFIRESAKEREVLNKMIVEEAFNNE
jgi:hypothetical protein